MTISLSDSDLELSQSVVETLLAANIFVSEGEVQTLTGYELQEYKALSKSMAAATSLEQLPPAQLTMIHQAANTLLGVPHNEEALYRANLGSNYDHRLAMLIKAIDLKTGRRRS